MKHNFTLRSAMGVWLLSILLLAFSCIPEEREAENFSFDFPEKVNVVPFASIFEGTDFSARRACDYQGCGEVFEVCLIAGQNIEVGKVEVYNDDRYVYFSALVTGDWYFLETQLKTDPTKSGLGQGSNPAPGQFPHKETYDPAVQKVNYVIPISETGKSFYFAFHASVVKVNEKNEVVQGETAWSCGESFVAQGSWATFSGLYNVYDCEEPPVELCWKDETAWSFGNCYNRERGNWASYTTYPGEKRTVKLMAGKIYEIGEVSFEPYGDDVKITINLFENGGFQDVSENVKIQGYNERPSGNPAPGQFNTHKGNASGSTYYVVVPRYRHYGVHVDAKVAIACEY